VPSERWNRLEQVFAEALALPIAARSAFLERACGDDADLRSDIDGLLRSHDAAGPADHAPNAPDAAAPLPSLAAGACLGSWRIEKLIGRGGMEKCIWRRVPMRLRATRRVKVIALRSRRRNGALPCRAAHSGQARTSGHCATARWRHGRGWPPYTVMEYVEGHSLTEYCCRHPSSLRERLALFAQVCEASPLRIATW